MMECTFCSSTSHYKDKCTLRASIHSMYEHVNEEFLTRLGTNMNQLGLSPGTLMKSRLRGDGLYLFNEFDPETINAGNLYQPTRSRRLVLPPRTNSNGFYFSVKRVTSPVPELMYMHMPMTLPNEYLEHPLSRSPIRPEGWIRHITLAFDGPGVYTPPFSDDYGADTYEIVDPSKSKRCMVTELLSAPKDAGLEELEEYFEELSYRKTYNIGSYLLEALMRYMWILDDSGEYEAVHPIEQSAINHIRHLRKARDWVHTVDAQTVLFWHAANGSKPLTYDKPKAGKEE